MRKGLGVLLLLGCVALCVMFSFWGMRLQPGAEKIDFVLPFRMLGSYYPFDAGMLVGAVWTLGLGLYFLFTRGPQSAALPAHVPATSKWAQQVTNPAGPAKPMAKIFCLNAMLLVTMLVMAFVGVRGGGDERFIASFSVAAGLQVAVGLLLLVLAVFEKPRGLAGILFGALFYLTGTAAGVLVFLWGQPGAQP